MNDITQTGDRTVIFVSHNIGAIQSLCNRCVVLHHGEVQTVAETDQAIKAYLDLTTSGDQAAGPFTTKLDGFTIEQVQLERIQHNQPLVTKFIVDNATGKSIENLRVGVQVFNTQLARVMTLTTEVPHIAPGKQVVRIIGEDTHLPPGNYNISIGMGVRDTGIFYEPQMILFEMQANDSIDPFIVSRRDVLGACPPTRSTVEPV